MSKIICDVCGTVFPETAEQCPICGSARPDQDHIVPDANQKGNSAKDTGYQYVRGGRFSKANVKKRAKAGEKEAAEAAPMEAEKPKSNRGLLIAVLVLLLAIVAMATFIFLRFFYHPAEGTDKLPGTSQTQETTGPQETFVPCTGLTARYSVMKLTTAGQREQLEITAEPADTTDTILFSSSNEAVVTVSPEGTLTAVSDGDAVVTVSCGSQTIQCRVSCAFTDVSNPTGAEALELDEADITLTYSGETHTLTAKGLENDAVTWTSADTSVAVVGNGTVTAVGAGETTVTASYNGQTAACVVRCQFPEETGAYTISHTDVTIAEGETFTVSLTDIYGDSVDTEWYLEDWSVCILSGSDVTGIASGETTVFTEYEGVTYSCIVRVN